MTEAEWLACTDPRRMLEFLSDKASDRKLRLFAVAICRTVWQYMTDERFHQGVELMETYAETAIPDNKLELLQQDIADAYNTTLGNYEPDWNKPDYLAASMVCDLVWYSPDVAADMILEKCTYSMKRTRGDDCRRAIPGQMLVELFGNPFHPVSFRTIWLTWHDDLIRLMAREMYESRNFADMPILADALEEAGCTNADILNHCRQPGEYVRGCWVIDLLLGKA